MRLARFAALATLLSGCDEVSRACTEEFRMGLVVRVRDSVTSTPAGQGASVTAREGSYLEELRASDGLTFVGAGERPGVYEVRVTRSGYATWLRTGVRVEHDGCHVETEEIDARLQPLAAGVD